MPVRVLIVDDSNFFQHRLKDIINENPELKVVGIASNGKEAVDKAAELNPDIITMDFEMPVMDGVTAIKHIMAHRKTPILMFSSLTYEGARITLDALAAGALDFIPKDFAEVSRSSASLKQKLHERLLTLARRTSIAVPEIKSSLSTHNQSSTTTSTTPSALTSLNSKMAANAAAAKASAAQEVNKPVFPSTAQSADSYKLKRQPKLLVIGASTGGPIALTEVLMELPQNFPVPVLLVQHMPENFTKAFAERLNKQCKIRVREAVDGDLLEPGLALLAPGGKQMMVDKKNPNHIRVIPDDDRMNYKPSLDVTFASSANALGDKVLGVVLTGMGSDGCKGAEILKQMGSQLWSQDEATSVIYGMPMAVAKAGLTDRVLGLKEIGVHLAREVT